MRNRHLLLFLAVLLAAALSAGCAKRQLTRSETDQLDAIAAKIAKAEQMDAKDCAPKELAYAKAEYDHARHEASESWENAQPYIRKADKAADELLEKTRPCWEARQPQPAPPPAAAPPPAPPPAAPAPVPREEALKFENIHFDFDSSAIRADAKPILQTVAAHMKKNRDARIQIEGHCDERGTAEYNVALGDRRAHAAKKYLVGLGVDPGRISTISYGEERALDPGHDEGAWSKNRRAVFVLQ